MKWWTKAQAYLHLQFLDKEQEETDEDLDFRALESGYVSKVSIIFVFSSYYVIQSYRSENDWI